MNFPLDIFQVIGCSLFKLDKKYLMRSLLHWWSRILLTIFTSNKIHWNKIFPPEINCLLSHFMLRSFNQQSSRHVTQNFFSSLGRVWDISLYLAGKEFVFLTCHYSLDWIMYPFFPSRNINLLFSLWCFAEMAEIVREACTEILQALPPMPISSTRALSPAVPRAVPGVDGFDPSLVQVTWGSGLRILSGNVDSSCLKKRILQKRDI